jgi:hypothetical protein
MPDGMEVGNLTGLCFNHHNQVTENKTRIVWDGEGFSWGEDGDLFPLAPQPPHHHQVSEENMETFEKISERLAEDQAETVEDDRPICPGCGRKLPKPKIDTPKEDKKPRGTWAIAIPMDERENGADVLDEMLEVIREKLDTVGMSYSEASNAKYYVLSTAMGLVLSHFDSVVADA